MGGFCGVLAGSRTQVNEQSRLEFARNAPQPASATQSSTQNSDGQQHLIEDEPVHYLFGWRFLSYRLAQGVAYWS